ncbi:16S rRNA (guanine(527)-N(7))-methyltransferase RsmG [OM182 bacterium]|nr:16S rRNA (guanine(527)-N(7))-methyltransferase RsmG [OM182 bacterium]
MDIRERLKKGIQDLGYANEVEQTQLDQFENYLRLLKKWNLKFNISGISDIDRMVSAHLLDSLSLWNLLNGENILDVGSGGGLPGIPLSILDKSKNFILLDSNGKKTRFLFQAKLELGLENIQIVNNRIEQYQSSIQIDTIVCRAFSSIATAIELTSSILKGSCSLLLMKGVYPSEEIKKLPAGYRVNAIHVVNVPFLNSDRHVIEVLKESGESL